MAIDSLTDVPGLRVGHAEVSGGGSGCTVILGPFQGGVERPGNATGTRELPTLEPGHLVSRIDALLLTGGSAFGLAAADGVMGWLADRGEGFPTAVAPVPIVPAAVLFDLVEGRGRPGSAEGRRACDDADSGPVRMGRVGAGAGATVGKLLGAERASPGGVGSASARVGRWTVGALAVVNALGQVVGRDGVVVAGVRTSAGFRNVTELLAEGRASAPGVGENTTLAVVATDAPLDREGLIRWLRVAATALPRRIDPVFTPFDGDVVFGVSTGREVPVGNNHGARGESEERGSDLSTLTPIELLSLGVAARETLETAILRGVAP